MAKIVFSPRIASRLIELGIYADVDFIQCDGCDEKTLPPTTVSGAQVCPHESSLLDEVEYHLEFGTTMCDWCVEVLVPAVQHPHDCTVVFVPEQWQ